MSGTDASAGGWGKDAPSPTRPAHPESTHSGDLHQGADFAGRRRDHGTARTAHLGRNGAVPLAEGQAEAPLDSFILADIAREAGVPE
ncbi:hypothetical protein AB0K46_29720, partial [Streptomyces cinnamoneus]